MGRLLGPTESYSPRNTDGDWKEFSFVGRNATCECSIEAPHLPHVIGGDKRKSLHDQVDYCLGHQGYIQDPDVGTISYKIVLSHDPEDYLKHISGICQKTKWYTDGSHLLKDNEVISPYEVRNYY